MVAQVFQAVGDPLHVLLDGHRHVADHRRALRPCNEKHVGKVVHRKADIGSRAIRPLLAQRHSITTADIHGEQCPSHGIEACGKDDDVHIMGVAVCSAHTCWGDLLHR